MCRRCIWLVAAIAVTTLSITSVDAFRSNRGLHTIVNKALDASKVVGGGRHTVEGMVPPSSADSTTTSGGGSTSSTTAFRARKVATTPDEVNQNVVLHGMKFSLREDHRCFVVEVDRPGDHAACTFHIISNISDRGTRNRVGRNVSVEWFSPLGISVAEFIFSPQHRCAERGRCLVRATPIAAETSAQGIHGVVSGAYSLCFRMTGPSIIAKIFQAFSSHKQGSMEELTIELLELSTESLLPPSTDHQLISNGLGKGTGRNIGRKPQRVVGAGSVPQRSLDLDKNAAPIATQRKLSSVRNRLQLLTAEVESIVREAGYSEERQGEFVALSNSLFTRIWVCGISTIGLTTIVLWGQMVVLRRHLVKKKVV
jgi:hypothetical protein